MPHEAKKFEHSRRAAAHEKVERHTANDSILESTERPQDDALHATFTEIEEALKKEEPTIVSIGGITRGPAALESRREYAANISQRFLSQDVLVLPYREEGYTAEYVQEQKREHKVVIVDSPLLFSEAMQAPWEGHEGFLSEHEGQRGSDAREWLRSWAGEHEVREETPSVEEMSESFERAYERLRSHAAEIGRVSLALPNSAPALAFLAYVYAKKNEGEFDGGAVEGLLEKIGIDDSGVIYLRFERGEEPSVWWNGNRAF